MARAVTRVVLWRSLIDVIVEGKATTVMSGIRSRRHTGSLWATPSGSRWATVDSGRPTRGSSKSAVSRTVVRRTRQRLHEHLTRRLDGLEVVALFMGGTGVARQA